VRVQTGEARKLNEVIRGNAALARELSVVPFFCECEDSRCIELVPLAPAEFDELRLTGRPVLSPHHVASDVPTRRYA
jgi:hypothetical protein